MMDKKVSFTLEDAYLDIIQLQDRVCKLEVTITSATTSVEFLKSWIDHSYSKNRKHFLNEVSEVKTIFQRMIDNLNKKIAVSEKKIPFEKTEELKSKAKKINKPTAIEE